MTIIVEGVFNADYQEYFEEYSQKVRNLLEGFDAKVIRRQLVKETLYGASRPGLIMLIDFEDEEVAKRIFFEEEYLAILPLREKVFQTFDMHLASIGNV